MIGSQSGMKTSLVLGVLPYNQEKVRNDAADLKALRKEMEELTTTLDRLEEEAQQGMAGMNEKLAKARLRKSVLSMKESQLLKHKEHLNQPAPVDLSKCRLECDTIYPPTSLRIQEAVWTTDQVRKACKLGYDEEIADIREMYV
jgi:ABC-type phosphate transport system auxiliary subunit